MNMFYVGQKVARVGGLALQASYGYPPMDVPCTVTNVFTTPEGTLQIELAEYPSPDDEFNYAGWRAKFFRPIVEKKTDISIFEEILTGVREPALT
jgi:hypothetical protein